MGSPPPHSGGRCSTAHYRCWTRPAPGAVPAAGGRGTVASRHSMRRRGRFPFERQVSVASVPPPTRACESSQIYPAVEAANPRRIHRGGPPPRARSRNSAVVADARPGPPGRDRLHDERTLHPVTGERRYRAGLPFTATGSPLVSSPGSTVRDSPGISVVRRSYSSALTSRTSKPPGSRRIGRRGPTDSC